jgi:aminoglycoside phosphotransferase family enzyme
LVYIELTSNDLEFSFPDFKLTMEFVERYSQYFIKPITLLNQDKSSLIYSVPYVSQYDKRIVKCFPILTKNTQRIKIKKQILSLYFDFLEFTELLLKTEKYKELENKIKIFGHSDLNQGNLLIIDKKIKIFDLDSFDFFIFDNNHLNFIIDDMYTYI